LSAFSRLANWSAYGRCRAECTHCQRRGPKRGRQPVSVFGQLNAVVGRDGVDAVRDACDWPFKEVLGVLPGGPVVRHGEGEPARAVTATNRWSLPSSVRASVMSTWKKPIGYSLNFFRASLPSSVSGSRLIPCLYRQRCSENRVRCRIVSCGRTGSRQGGEGYVCGRRRSLPFPRRSELGSHRKIAGGFPTSSIWPPFWGLCRNTPPEPLGSPDCFVLRGWLPPSFWRNRVIFGQAFHAPLRFLLLQYTMEP